MPKIKCLKDQRWSHGSYNKDQILTVSEELAATMIKHNYAILVDEPFNPVEEIAVFSPPETKAEPLNPVEKTETKGKSKSKNPFTNRKVKKDVKRTEF